MVGVFWLFRKLLEVVARSGCRHGHWCGCGNGPVPQVGRLVV